MKDTWYSENQFLGQVNHIAVRDPDDSSALALYSI